MKTETKVELKDPVDTGFKLTLGAGLAIALFALAITVLAYIIYIN